MAISGLNPINVPSAGLVPNGAVTLAGSNPLLGLQAQGGIMPSGAALGAQAGVVEQPGIGTRLMSAMKAAIGELRGTGASDARMREQVLAMQAQQPVAVARPVAAKPVAKRPRAAAAPLTPRERANAEKAKANAEKKIAALAARAAAAAPAGAAAVGTTLPSNATQLPGATVYSYDANGNPVMAPTMQQLGVSPGMLQGLTGMAQAADPDGRQLNATNQTNLGGVGTGIGMVPGSAVPIIGQPIVQPTSPGDTPAGPPAAPGSAASTGSQVVSNRNTTDIANRNQGIAGYGGYGGYGSMLDPTGGVATPWSPYGSSMTGAYALGTATRGGIGGFFSRLLGS